MSKKLFVLLALVMLIVPLASVNAQTLNEGIDYCKIMESDDCQMLVDSANAMAMVSSFSFDMALNYDIAVDGGEMSGMENMNFGIVGTGLMAVDNEALSTMQNLAMSDPQAYMAQLPQLMDSIFTSVEGEASMVISLPEMMVPMVGTSEIPLNIMAENGQYVVDVASLESALGEEPSGMGWAGIDLTGAFSLIMEDFDMTSMLGEMQLEDMMYDMDDLAGAMSINRLADSEVDGVPVAVFETTLDYAVLMESMGMSEMLESMYSDMGMDQEEIDGVLSMLNGIQLGFTQSIGLEDSYLYLTEMTMNFSMDGESMGEPDMGSMTLDMSVVFGMNDFNTPVDVELPEDAMIMPFEMLMGSGL